MTNENIPANIFADQNFSKFDLKQFLEFSMDLGSLEPEVAIEFLKNTPEFISAFKNGLDSFYDSFKVILNQDQDNNNQFLSLIKSCLDSHFETNEKELNSINISINKIRETLSNENISENDYLELKKLLEEFSQSYKHIKDHNIDIEMKFLNLAKERIEDQSLSNKMMMGGILTAGVLVTLLGAGLIASKRI
ncbi:hypothetical protein [Veillonella sp.]|uniref:hypothetical protein n=1 Tax=Veillonella sp. TaxID=1926307 RepID=UPI002B25CE97|nr:hypothetical protein [Veillonella sp.]